MIANLMTMNVSKTLKCQVHVCGPTIFSSDQYMSQDTLKLSYPLLKLEPIPWITSREFMCVSLTPPRGESCASNEAVPIWALFACMHIINILVSNCAVLCCVVLCCVLFLFFLFFYVLFFSVTWRRCMDTSCLPLL